MRHFRPKTSEPPRFIVPENDPYLAELAEEVLPPIGEERDERSFTMVYPEIKDGPDSREPTPMQDVEPVPVRVVSTTPEYPTPLRVSVTRLVLNDVDTVLVSGYATNRRKLRLTSSGGAVRLFIDPQGLMENSFLISTDANFDTEAGTAVWARAADAVTTALYVWSEYEVQPPVKFAE